MSYCVEKTTGTLTAKFNQSINHQCGQHHRHSRRQRFSSLTFPFIQLHVCKQTPASKLQYICIYVQIVSDLCNFHAIICMYATKSYYPNTLIDHADLFHRIFCTDSFCNIINNTFILQRDNVHKLSISMSNGNKVKQIFSFTPRARHMYTCFIYSNALRLHNKYKQAVIITIFIPSPSSLFASHYFVRHVLLSFTNN